MAEALLKAWNAPKIVAAVEINATTSTITRAENAKVTILRAGNGLSGTATDGALPFPLALDGDDKALALAVRSSDVVEALDQEPLKVSGLSAARYQLKIDGEKVGQKGTTAEAEDGGGSKDWLNSAGGSHAATRDGSSAIGGSADLHPALHLFRRAWERDKPLRRFGP